MSDQPPPPDRYPEQPSPYGPQHQGVQAGPLIGGLVIGFVVGLVYSVLAFFAGTVLSDAANTSGAADGLLFALPQALPVLVATVLLSIRKTRIAGAGLLMGVAIGAIVMPGVCVVLLGGMAG